MKPEELDRLIHRYFEGDLSPEEEGLLWSVIRIDPASADRFVELSELESAMVESLKAEEAAPPEVRTTRRDSRRHSRVMAAVPERRPVWPLFFAAGVMIAFLVLLIQSAGQPRPAEIAVRQVEPPKTRPAAEPAPVRNETPAPKAETPRPIPTPDPVRPERTPIPDSKPVVDPQPPQPKTPEKTEPPAPEKSSVIVKAPTVEATIVKVEGDVVDDAGVAAKAGQAMISGQGLDVRKGSALVALIDGTQLELRPDTKLDRIVVTAEQKRLVLSRGVASSTIVRQSLKVPLVFQTPHAEVTVVGTKLLIDIAKDSTRVDVHEGRVRFKRLPDSLPIEIAAGSYAIASKGPAPVARRIPIVRSFQDGVAPTADYRGTQDTEISSKEQTANFGKIEQLQLQRLSDQQTVLLKWDLTAIPAGSKVVSAELTFWVTGKLVGDCKIHALNLPFEESEATWRFAKSTLSWSAPGAQAARDRGVTPIALLAPSQPGFHTAMITDLGVVQTWINAPKENFGILIAGPDANIWGLESRETAMPDRRPKLTITYISGK